MSLLLLLACSAEQPWFHGSWRLVAQTIATQTVEVSGPVLELEEDSWVWDGVPSTCLATEVTADSALLTVSAADGRSFTTSAQLDAEDLVLRQGEHMVHRLESLQ